jgi:hypothetical protein
MIVVLDVFRFFRTARWVASDATQRAVRKNMI